MRRLEAGRDGVTAVHEQPCGARHRMGECGRCGRQRPIRGRGLCSWCQKLSAADGTLADYGYVKADRIADYAELRRALSIPQAAARIGVSERTATRYEAALREMAPGCAR